jgi:hypothetical protein
MSMKDKAIHGEEAQGRAISLDSLAVSKWYYPLLAPFSERYNRKAVRAGTNISDTIVLDHMVTADFPKIVFTKNSKAACTSIVHAIYTLATGVEYEGRIHQETDVLYQGKDAWNTLLARREMAEYVTSTFVRNPINRLESAFRDFILEQRNPNLVYHKVALEQFGCFKNTNESESFEAFLTYVEASIEASPSRTDRHWRPQVDNIGLGWFDYDFIGKVENLQEDLRTLLAMAGVDNRAIDQVTPTRKNSSRSSNRIASEEQISRIRTLYAADFEAFDYD